MNITITLDQTHFSSKEEAKRNVKAISNRIASQELTIDISTIAKEIGSNGCTWMPFTYLHNRRIQKDFKSCQLFALDFDNGIPYDTVKNKFNKYNIPISFSYYTLSSTPDKPKYRIVLCHEAIITDNRIAKFILLMLKNLFSKEADLSCFEIARIYFGGKELIEVNDNPRYVFNVYDLSCTYQKIMRENDMKHFAEKQRKISNECQIELMGKSLFNLQCFDTSLLRDFKRSSNIIYIELPTKSQVIAISLAEPIPLQTPQQHKREMKLSRLEKINNQKICGICRLWDDFYKGTTYLTHNERFALALNVIYIKGMEKTFFEIHDINYPGSNQIKWITDIEYAKANDYQPQNCSFCKYKDHCSHKYSLYETLKERTYIYPLNHSHEYVPVDEAYTEMETTFKKFLKKNSSKIYLIKAQTGLGKTRMYVDLIKNSISMNHKPYLIAVPTTNLKTEIYEKIGSTYITNFPSLEDAKAFFKTEETIHYMLPVHLENVKMTILSATLNSKLYGYFFPEKTFKFFETKEVEYKGNLIQYCHYSTSKNKLRELGNKLHSTSILFQKITESIPNYDYAITFKEFESNFADNVLHFGNATGIDCYSGKDGIIIGTYHLPESVYKLAACYVHSSRKNLHKQTLNRRKVYFNGYCFPLMSYKDELLQLIQLYLISTELEQAVGRSRLLRTASTVYLFSNFPCYQAKLSHIDYLYKENADALTKGTDN